MGFATGGQHVLRLTSADVGKRVSVRALLEGSGAPEKFTDTVGVLTRWDDGVLHITRRSGESVRIAESVLVAGKVVPAAPARGRGPAASFRELAGVMARSWQPVESERLGGWELRAAGGFTRRVNSVLPLGEPGIPLDEALATVRRWYAERGLPAYVQTSTGAEGTQEQLCAELEARGWWPEVSAQVHLARLAPLADSDVDTAAVRLTREADEVWLARYHRSGGGAGAVERAVLAAGPSVWFASVPGGPGQPPAAIGRCVVDGRWAGFMAVEVAAERRREGLGTAVMAALAGRALEEGASAAWLQVESDNAAALALYAGMGFGAHHSYQHYRAPEVADTADRSDAAEATGGADAADGSDAAEAAGEAGTATADADAARG